MPKFIVKLTDPLTADDYYVEWSTVCDAPTSAHRGLPAFTEYYRGEYGEAAMESEFPERMARVALTGTSSRIDTSARVTVAGNRAGPEETELTYDQLIEYIAAECAQEQSAP